MSNFVSEGLVLRRILGKTKMERTGCVMKNSVTFNLSRRMGWVGHIVRIGRRGHL
jgi:hypothetical protein